MENPQVVDEGRPDVENDGVARRRWAGHSQRGGGGSQEAQEIWEIHEVFTENTEEPLLFPPSQGEGKRERADWNMTQAGTAGSAEDME
ncbi:hypothetical protein AAFF_G00190230 [Aldrovandia affinis]|uniref:Uncharacterized protein n=1 Tax=Aldrovandia affinis TaxID=143900 RepID=A0AAD7RJL1_9TELE|nr:hypothetical protein AAFF_G00190230 [Aldrovandia affinis]